MENDRPTRVLMVEDDRQIANFVSRGLREEGYEVDIAGDGIQGLELARKGAHDIVILDIVLPGMDGLKILECLREEKINAPVLILSARRNVSDRIMGLKAGGDDYLVKPFAFAELLARIQSILRRAGGVKEPVRLEVSDLVVDLLGRRVSRGEEQIDLQHQEFRLLEYLARNRGRVVTRTQILQNVWGYNFNPSTNVVEVHICRLREKIERPDRPQLIRTVRGAGYVLAEEK